MTLRSKCYRLLTAHPHAPKSTFVAQLFIQSLILLNVAALVLHSVASIRRAVGEVPFLALEALSITLFTIEYGLRVWSCVEDPQFAGPGGRWRFVRSPLAIVDLLAILPYFFAFAVSDLRILRLLRLMRLLRLGKMARYSRAFDVLWGAISRKREELVISLTIFTIFALIGAALLYFLEHEAQPTIFASIPHALWWAVVTLTTVGYGDVVPITVAGKMVSACVAIIGVAFFALLAGVLVVGLTEEMEARRG